MHGARPQGEVLSPAPRPRRPYRLKARAERQAQTRHRIVAAALALHETAGPARTTISAIAERARVQRLTVYRHFPDDRALLAACWAELVATRPLPDMAAWFQLRDPVGRLRRALTELFGYYRATAPLTERWLADAADEPAVRDELRPLLEPLAILPTALAEGWPTLGSRGRARLAAVLRHALAFPTWRSLTGDEGLSDDEAADLLVGLALGAARGDA